jgi:hypothetical protein
MTIEPRGHGIDLQPIIGIGVSGGWIPEPQRPLDFDLKNAVERFSEGGRCDWVKEGGKSLRDPFYPPS